MKKKSLLSVRPVRHYRVPKYPSWQDANPLEHPETIPYPLQQRVWHAITASGLVSTLMFSATQCSNEFPGEKYGIQRDSLYNPFTFLQSGLPYHAPFFGTGQPERLREKEVREVIEKVFAAQGFHLQPDYLLQSGQHTILLQGFDPANKTGYVFIPGNRLDKDGVVSEFLEEEPVPSERYFHLAIRYFERGDSEYYSFDIADRLKKQLDRLKKIPDTLTRNQLVRSAVMEDYIRVYLAIKLPPKYSKEVKFPSWLYKQVRAALKTSDPEQRAKSVNQCVSSIDLLWLKEYEYYYVPKEVLQLRVHLVEALHQMDKFPLELPELKKILKIFYYYDHCDPRDDYYPPDPKLDYLKKIAEEKQAFILQALNSTGDTLMRNLQALSLETDAYFVSLAEIQALDSLSKQGKIFIAPLSQYGPGFRYDYRDTTDLSQMEKELATARAAKDTATVNKLQQELQEFKPVKLKELEQNMHRYLLWARKQGRF